MESSSANSGDRSRPRRFVEATAFVAVYILIGELIDASEHIQTYLLLSIPLAAGFQLAVRRRRIPDLWVRGSPGVARQQLTIGIAVAVAIFPVYAVVKGIVDSQYLALVLSSAAAIVGAGAAGYAFGHFTRQIWVYLALCTAIVVAIGVGMQFALDEAFAGKAPITPKSNVLLGVTSFLIYLPTTFVIEEVVFRGAVDAHVHHPGDGHWWLSAIYVSALWTAWHGPAFGWDVAAVAALNMIPIGVVLSTYWRKSGNLAVTGTAHAASDAVRNGMMGGVP